MTKRKIVRIPSGSTGAMIAALRSAGLAARDCSMTAEPQIHSIYVKGVEKMNVVLHSDYNYYVEIREDGTRHLFNGIPPEEISPTKEYNLAKCKQAPMLLSAFFISIIIIANIILIAFIISIPNK